MTSRPSHAVTHRPLMLNPRVLVRLALLGAVLCLIQGIQEGARRQRRRELSRQLAPALDEGDWRKVAQLVRQGADPLARGADGSTALASVLTLGDVVAARKILSDRPDDLLLVSREVTALPTRAFEPLYRLEDCVSTLERVVRQPGAPLVNAWLGLGELRYRLGKYDAAAEAYRTADRLAPGGGARGGLDQALAAGEASHRIAAEALGGREKVAQVAPASAGDPSLWYALSTPYWSPNRPWLDLLRANLALYRVDAHGCRRLGPVIDVHDPRTLSPPERAALFGQDLTGDGIPDAAVETTTSVLGADPSYLEIFTAGPQGPVRLLSLTSSEQLWLEDLNGDGKVEVRNQYEIGDTLSHVAQPRWSDVYAFDGSRYVKSNRRFPEAFREWPQTLEELLREYPGDPGLLEYQGRAYEITGWPPGALSCYRRAEPALTQAIGQTDPQYRPPLLERREWVRGRLRALNANESK